jgi:hypothetical protein
MTYVSAFDDDALGELDATGVVEAIRSGAVSRVDVVEAAIARTQKVNPQLNGLAYEAFDAARARASAKTPYGGYFDGVPTFVKDNVAVEGMPTMEGADAWRPRPERANGDFARAYLSTGLVALGKTQLSEFGFSAAAEHPRLGAVRNPWNADHRGRVVVRVGSIRGGRRGADRPRQRRRRVDPDPGVVQRPGRPQTVAWSTALGPEHARYADPNRGERGADSFGAGHGGVLP